MRSRMACVFLVVFMLPAWVYLTLSAWQRADLHQQAEQIILSHLPDSLLHRFVLVKEAPLPRGFTWKRDREFRYEGVYYDVVHSMDQGDSLILLAWADHDESALEARCRELLQQLMGSDPVSSKARDHWFRFLRQLFPPTPYMDPGTCAEILPTHVHNRTNGLTTQNRPFPPAPPPEWI